MVKIINVKTIWNLLVGIFFIGGVIYIFLPTPTFPNPPPGAVQSMEDADIETSLKKAYFTNYTREQVIAHYKNQFRLAPFIVRLNYPPEESQTLIRDQTRSTYLEELVHPLRESMFINGFEPRQAKDDIWYKGIHFQEKIIIKYIPSSGVSRLIILILIFLVGKILFKEWKKTIWTFPS